MNIPVESVSSWQISLSPDGQQLILRPWVTKRGSEEEPAQSFALSLDVARALERQLGESIHLLQQTADASLPAERRKAQQRVPNDRRKARHFEGSAPSRTASKQTSDQNAPQKPEE